MTTAQGRNSYHGRGIRLANLTDARKRQREPKTPRLVQARDLPRPSQITLERDGESKAFPIGQGLEMLAKGWRIPGFAEARYAEQKRGSRG